MQAKAAATLPQPLADDQLTGEDLSHDAALVAAALRRRRFLRMLPWLVFAA